MKTLQLSELEQDILYVTLMDAGASVVSIARRIGTKPHIVQAAVSKFRREGVISRRVIIDITRIGFSTHEFFISLSSEGQRAREAVVEYLKRSPWVGTVLEVGGEYDLMLTVRVRNQREMVEFQTGLSERFPGMFTRKDTSLAVEHWAYGEKFLVSNPSLYMEYHLQVPPFTVAVDEIDKKILFEIGDPAFGSMTALARRVGLPTTTVEYRVKKLAEKKVILGDLHELRGELIGLSNYVLLLGMNGVSEAINREVCEAARLNPFVPWLSRGAGHWDYVMGLVVRAPSEVPTAVNRLRTSLGSWMTSYQIVPMFRAHKVRDYPLDPAYEAQALQQAGLSKNSSIA